jgi:hypothetical protein
VNVAGGVRVEEPAIDLFRRAITPRADRDEHAPARDRRIEVVQVRTLSEALEVVL